MNNSITAQATEKAGACFAWIKTTEKAGACFAWINQESDNAMQRPTVDLVMEDLESTVK
ncbi:MAG: hypothetical protein AAFN40_11465 [Cyanobacteria bacterium J06560_6]